MNSSLVIKIKQNIQIIENIIFYLYLMMLLINLKKMNMKWIYYHYFLTEGIWLKIVQLV